MLKTVVVKKEGIEKWSSNRGEFNNIYVKEKFDPKIISFKAM